MYYKGLPPQVAKLAPIMRKGRLVWQVPDLNLQPSFRGAPAGG
ncbi:hypothetical protein N234_21180 [Ralstonia pickettii DTP0602]|nr:hypothetical protein N234_21180 [Ralstonia pickettii DTP0602]